MSRTNRDHAKKKQRPMIEDEAIAKQLEALLDLSENSQPNHSKPLQLFLEILPSA
jgi:hypothetical protein